MATVNTWNFCFTSKCWNSEQHFIPLYCHWTRSMPSLELSPFEISPSISCKLHLYPLSQSFLSSLLIMPLGSLFESLRLPLHPRHCPTLCSQSSPLPPPPQWGFICTYCQNRIHLLQCRYHMGSDTSKCLQFSPEYLLLEILHAKIKLSRFIKPTLSIYFLPTHCQTLVSSTYFPTSSHLCPLHFSSAFYFSLGLLLQSLDFLFHLLSCLHSTFSQNDIRFFLKCTPD